MSAIRLFIQLGATLQNFYPRIFVVHARMHNQLFALFDSAIFCSWCSVVWWKIHLIILGPMANDRFHKIIYTNQKQIVFFPVPMHNSSITSKQKSKRIINLCLMCRTRNHKVIIILGLCSPYKYLPFGIRMVSIDCEKIFSFYLYETVKIITTPSEMEIRYRDLCKSERKSPERIRHF